jgi:CrcB protein
VTVLLVALGAVVGASLRHLVSRALPGEPGTLLVNVVGSFVLGVLVGADPDAQALVGVGFCGALTTFSTFALEAVDGVPARRTALAVARTLALCLPAAALGHALR